MSAKFILKSPTAKESIIFLFTQYKGVRFKYSLGTNYKVRPELWTGSRAIDTQKELKGTDLVLTTTDRSQNQKINSRLALYEGTFITACSYFDTQKICPSNELFKEYFDKEYNKTSGEKKSADPSLNEFLSIFINEITTGKRKTQSGSDYKKNTLKEWKSFQTMFNEYQDKNRKVNYKDITIEFYDSFTKHFYDKNYSINSVGKMVKFVKAIMKAAKEKGYHANDQYSYKKFQKVRHDADNAYLTKDEIQALYDLQFTEKHLEVARDVFLIGCCMAMRYSDYSRINKDMIKVIDGYKYIQVSTKKTGTRVTVPINEMCDSILQKYDYTLPKTYEQKLNKNIKPICKKAGIKSMEEYTTTNGGSVMTRHVPKHQMITTHTARRTGATLMYFEGIPIRTIMKITGHKTETAFLRYLKLDDEQAAIMITKHRNEKHLKVV
jgi:integrase